MTLRKLLLKTVLNSIGLMAIFIGVIKLLGKEPATVPQLVFLLVCALLLGFIIEVEAVQQIMQRASNK